MRLWVVLLSAPACSTQRTSVRDECGITERVPYGWAERLTDRCIARLADDVGLEWATFGVERSQIGHNGSSSVAMVLSGLYTLAASDTGLGWMLSRQPTPMALRTEFLAQPEADASEFWYAMVARRVDRIVYRPDVPPQDHLASYNAARMEVSVADLQRLPDLSPSVPAPLPPLSLAATLVHEAAHAFAKDHSPGSQSIDLDNNGANGVEATWLYGWIVANGAAVSSVDRNSACWLLAGVCRRIPVESFPCQKLPVLCADSALPLSAPHP